MSPETVTSQSATIWIMVLPSLKNKLKFRVKKQERRILANPSY
jgi:hypothetical protein